SKVRRERMGHIELAAPVVHIWYLRGTRSWLAYLLMGTQPREELKAKQLEKVIYFAANIVTWVDEEKRDKNLPNIEQEVALEREAIEKERELELARRQEELEAELAELEAQGAKESEIKARQRAAERDLVAIRERYDQEIEVLGRAFEEFKNLFARQIIDDEMLWRELVARFGEYFEGGMGAEAISRLIARIDLDEEEAKLRAQIDPQDGSKPLSAQRKQKAIKRLKIVAAFNRRDEQGRRINDPRAMILDVVPVIPPELRPMVQLDGGRFATSDLNDLYRRVINRNNRLKRLLDLGAPEIIVNNEKRMLQEAVDALFDNGRRGRPVTGPGNRPLKSLSDMLKGKQGRFRQNLLGKRVDYSGRSVIVVGPQLKLHQCGLPKGMAIELFKPFVMKRLVDLNHAQNIKSAKRMVERARPVVWDVLEEVIAEHPVLLNRAPTLHRLGIQAFEPQLIEGKAIQIHPLVCTAFNADFDGDQMAVHLPLSAEAQAEARILMLSTNNILKPSDGRPVTMPTHDMVIGIFFLTMDRDGLRGEGRAFSSPAEAIMAFDRGEIQLQSKIKIRFRDIVPPNGWTPPEGWESGQPVTLETTLGRALFNEVLPPDYPYVNHEIGRKQLAVIVNDLAERYPKIEVAACLDGLKDIGFSWATRSGVTISIKDVITPARKQEILAAYEEKDAKVQKQFDRGLITDEERRQELIEIWTQAKAEVSKEMEEAFDKINPIFMMVHSGARGNMMQVGQIAAMRGLVANPKGEIIPRPIKSNYREGLSVVEFFIATHGARKGLADTALRTAESGYLTRRLVDVSQDIIVREADCGTERGLVKRIAVRQPDGTLRRAENVETSVYARGLAEDVKDADGNVIAVAGTDLGDLVIDRLIEAGIEEIRVRSVLTCDSKFGACAACYGRSLATGKPVDVGEAVGIIAAQSIGEPGTQLTMRTFHTGGVAGEDITHGLPRVQEIFEARQPKGKAPIAEVAGRVRIEDSEKSRKIVIVPDDGSEEKGYPVSKRARLLVEEGTHVEVGQQLTHGTPDPQDILRVLGMRAVQQHLVDEVQEIYRSQGVAIHDKHIETIVRQMLRRVTVIESGDSELLPGELVDRVRFEEENRRVVAEGGTPASGRPVLMGITKASLATDSWLSAASFQETTKVLTEAAINAKSDQLRGLKENVIIGKLIPAGTGMERYRNIRVEPTEEARAAMYSMVGYEGYDTDYSFGTGSSEAVRLEDFDFGGYTS
ncbi:MAG TPA: DNA-directed RNA polymerase subunit beta', partial [Actinopolymorphaceae bacterium]